MRIRYLLIAPLVAGVALLSACSGDDSSNTTSTETASSAATKVYLGIVKTSGASYSSDDAAIAAGKQACSDLSSGKSMVDVVDGMSSEAGGKGQAAAIVGAAIPAFCPDQKDKILPSQLRPSS
ncbi:DUF732 domain-containing protein [Gordonia neofelifaecis]|uniref:DUF732 domain-containing protein n=1 Tax=Gordonia neofelifaecis NRRL B-59395 TaxID=644548 RepID=F1YN43_9ACTN|nr:DUF732 domain-containing protein [Gordonia neofelifaecis]EGD53930.1 hypothetical protein SCNU_16753 [Gordonia neofelifaecis NRRL B-59395]